MGRGSRLKLSKSARAYHTDVTKILEGHRITPFDGPVRFTAYYYFQRRGSDVGNRSKILMDVLQGFAYHNDRQICEERAYRRLDHRNPRVELEIETTDEIEDCSCKNCH